MHARGEKVEAIIREAEEQEMAESVIPLTQKLEGLILPSPDFEEGQADDQPVNDHRAKNDGAAVSSHSPE
jgi:hypothetical protein